MEIIFVSAAIFFLGIAAFAELLVIYKKLSGATDEQTVETFFARIKPKQIAFAVTAYLVILLLVWALW